MNLPDPHMTSQTTPRHAAAPPQPAAGTGLADATLVAAATVFGALPLFGNAGALELTAALGVAGISLLAAWRGRRARHADATPAAVDDASASDRLHRLSSLLVGVLPVWLQHVGTVRTQTEDAIGKAVQSFASITEQCEAAGFEGVRSSARNREQESISLLTLCERQLRPVISTMTQMLDSKDAMLAIVNDLSRATVELQDMANGVGHMAAQTNMLAINAAIEAARIGDAGRGFAVIAKEIRALSQVSAQTSKQITDRVDAVTKMVQATVETASSTSASDKTALELAGCVVQDVLTHVRELSVNAEKMRAQGGVIRADIEDLFVNLQFQDRVSQIITVIDNNIVRLNTTLERNEAVPDTDEWLGELRRAYTTGEQRRVHATNSGEDASARPAAEVLFF